MSTKNRINRPASALIDALAVHGAEHQSIELTHDECMAIVAHVHALNSARKEAQVALEKMTEERDEALYSFASGDTAH